jgi:hypothetical protein
MAAIPDVVSLSGGQAGIISSPDERDAPNSVDQLIQQAGVLAKQLRRERAEIEGSGGGRGRPAVKALEQQVVQVWKAIRAARSSGPTDIEVVRRRYKWD